MPDDSGNGAWDLITVPWHLNEHIPDFPVPDGAIRTFGQPLPAGTQISQMTSLFQAVAETVAQASRPLLLTGDCTTALGAVAGLQTRQDVAVVWLDGHGDFNTPATTITGYLAGMSLALLTGRAPELFGDPLGLRPVAEADAVLVDARDLDPAERDALAASQVRRVPAEADAVRLALGGLGDKPVYLHVDADIIDSTQAHGLRFPAGPGPALARVEECLAIICGSVDVVAACLACTWLPGQVGGPPTRQAITRLAAALGARLTWRKPGSDEGDARSSG